MSAPDLVEVRLLRLPVPLWAASQEHTDELLREFTLMGAGSSHQDGSAHEVPARLVALVDRVTKHYSGASAAQRSELFAAVAQGRPELDLLYTVPPAVADVAAELGRMLDEADVYCREGQHLLTLATPDGVLAYRRWHLGQFVEQCAGAAPVAWPEWVATRS